MRYMLYLSERVVKFVLWSVFSYLCGICKAVLKTYLNSIKLHQAKIEGACGNGYKKELTNTTKTILDQKVYVCY